MKTLRQLLLEIPVGNQLFADPEDAAETLDYSPRDVSAKLKQFLKAKGIPTEKNTPEESKLLQVLNVYLSNPEDSMLNAQMLDDLLTLKHKFPSILSPDKTLPQFIYRGTTIPLKTAVSTFKKGKAQQGWLLSSMKTNLKVAPKSKRGFISFSTDLKIASEFGSSKGHHPDKLEAAIKKGFIYCTTAVKSSDVTNKLLFSREFIDVVGNFDEKEVIFVGKSYPTDHILIDWKTISDIKRLEIDLPKEFDELTNLIF